MSTPVAISRKSSSCFCGYNSSPSGSNRKRIRLPGVSNYEDMLMEGMKNLSFDQIQREQELLHGVANEVDLNENTINDLLLGLETHLNLMKEGTAYEAAERQDPSYVSNRELQLAFLRASHFEPKASAEKLMNFFRYKQGLFGAESLVRDITVQDLDQDDLSCLLEGYFQYSPFRDRSGRMIHLEFPGVRSKTAVRTELRARFYMSANSVETMVDISKGTVIVSYMVEQYKDHLKGAGFLEALNLFQKGLPIRIDGLHICYSNPIECMVTRTCISILPHRERVKSRVHLGSHTECQYLLASYGITRGALPLKGLESEMDLNHHNAWFQRRILREKEQRQHVSFPNPSSGSPATPQHNLPSHDTASGPNSGNENDVLSLGQRVKTLGNERLLSLALIYATAYANGSISNRRTIVSAIIDEVHRHGGRFLKPDPQSVSQADSLSSQDEGRITWVELSQDEQRAKVTQLFRNLRRRRSRTCISLSNTPTLSRPPIILEHIGPNDVLFGQRSDNPGNQRLREIVAGLSDEYSRTDRGKKKNTVSQLIKHIQKRGGRFLKPSANHDGRWEVASDEAAHEKVSKQFRNMRRLR
ncbi:unnamed protein product [Cylindrotheca closterium]|uniref:DUF6824 domain-containing protein n=1 Tax=Cylindrotheca closterium TaxID=2856 RepID=A0AAD2FZJ3_9STRA|nr:unnamed protein product [Cylindrotheca closterium]CAJ1958304.1 unnamed protein product [Cylindrotheca closterium]